jgi:hypothetical protein
MQATLKLLCQYCLTHLQVRFLQAKKDLAVTPTFYKNKRKDLCK